MGWNDMGIMMIFDMDAVHFVIFDADLYIPSSLNLIIAANTTYCHGRRSCSQFLRSNSVAPTLFEVINSCQTNDNQSGLIYPSL